MPRDIGSLVPSDLDIEEIEYWEFIKIVLEEDTLFFTNRPGGYTGVIGDNSTQVWEEYEISHGPLKQTMQSVLAVVSVTFPNIDFTWTNYAYTQGLRNKQVSIYTAWFDISTSLIIDSYITYEGRIDDGELDEVARLSLKPFFTPWDQPVPFTRIGGKCINDYRNPDDCQYAGAEPVGQVTCGKTRQHCRDRGNEAHINIYDDLPIIGQTVVLGGIPRILNNAPE